MKLDDLRKPLEKEDLELRVGTCSKSGFTLLLYKTARVDMARLNNVCGMNWSNSHKVDEKGNVTCEISIYDEEHKHWVSRQDTGSESNTEKEKGSYSDSFKRAGFRWGIGIELYKSPLIWVSGNTKDSGRKNKAGYPVYEPDLKTYNLEITRYEIIDDIPHLTIMHKNEVLFNNFKTTQKKTTTTKAKKTETKKASKITLSDVAPRIEKAKNAGFELDRILDAFSKEYGKLEVELVDQVTAYYEGL